MVEKPLEQMHAAMMLSSISHVFLNCCKAAGCGFDLDAAWIDFIARVNPFLPFALMPGGQFLCFTAKEPKRVQGGRWRASPLKIPRFNYVGGVLSVGANQLGLVKTERGD